MSRHDKFPALLLGEKAVRERCVLSSEVKASEMDASVALPPPIRCLSHMHSALLNMPIKSWQGNLFVGVRQPPHLSVRFAPLRMTSLRHSDTALRLLTSITKVEGFI
ncbi:hypothetical protein FPOAC2_03568 [Fusarium poae]